MKLSILMAAYNEERFLPKALKQALSVDYGCDMELIVVDDGSSDSTPEILNNTDDQRVRVFRQRPPTSSSTATCRISKPVSS